MTNTIPLCVYIHWPFCKAKCPYCDFNSHVRERVDQERWKKALLREMEWMAARMPAHTLASMFFGGGTPSLMPPETVAALIAQAKALFPPQGEPEITLEANPTSVEAANFRYLREAGVNRVSLGVQSLRPEGLKFLGRQHSVEEALRAVELAAGIFPRYSFDLIYARPQQTVAQWEEELREAMPYIDGHASLYQLTIEEETPFARIHAAGNFTLPSEEVAALLYEKTAEILQEEGVLPYEVSNYAKPGQECFHNLEIWRGAPYLGIGPGAHGRVEMSGLGLPIQEKENTDPHRPEPGIFYATSTLKSPERWLAQVEKKGHGLDSVGVVTDAERFEERLLMGLRLVEGIDLTTLPCPSRIHRLLASSKLRDYCTLGVMEREGDRLRLTDQGRLLLDYLVAELITA